jgi:hypothetical protein
MRADDEAEREMPERDRGPEHDPLLALSGVFESEVTDISDRHDDYIGHSLLGRSGEGDDA